MKHIVPDPKFSLQLPAPPQKDEKSQIQRFNAWIKGKDFFRPNLAAYRDYLLSEGAMRGSGLAPSSVAAHLAHVRKAYRIFLDESRDLFFHMASLNGHRTPSDQKAFVDELTVRLEIAIAPRNCRVHQIAEQDRPDSRIRRLTITEARQLLDLPGDQTLAGLRDKAIIAMFLGTGVREGELVQIRLSDLGERLDGRPALLVRQGKGMKQRMIPYGNFRDLCLDNVAAWAQAASINAPGEYVFRGFYPHGEKLRPKPLTTHSVERILKSYPLTIGGKFGYVRPHDLRRTYARLLYDSGMDILAIRDNLGHVDAATTQIYIGALNARTREPQGDFSLS